VGVILLQTTMGHFCIWHLTANDFSAHAPHCASDQCFFIFPNLRNPYKDTGLGIKILPSCNIKA